MKIQEVIENVNQIFKTSDKAVMFERIFLKAYNYQYNDYTLNNGNKIFELFGVGIVLELNNKLYFIAEECEK